MCVHVLQCIFLLKITKSPVNEMSSGEAEQKKCEIEGCNFNQAPKVPNKEIYGSR